jgi:hypothetical protein
VFVLGRIHIVAQRVGGGPKLGFESATPAWLDGTISFSSSVFPLHSRHLL